MASQGAKWRQKKRRKIIRKENRSSHDFLRISYDFPRNSYDFHKNFYDFLKHSYDFPRSSYDFPRNSYDFLRNSYDFHRSSYDFLRNSYDFHRNSYDFPKNSYRMWSCLRIPCFWLQSCYCQEKQSRETQTLKSPRNTTRYKRNTDSEIPQNLKNIRKNKEKHKETRKSKENLQKCQGPWPVAGGVLCQWRHCTGMKP